MSRLRLLISQKMKRILSHVGKLIRELGVSVTIDKKYLEWIDKKVKDLTFANRSHAFEYAIRHLAEEEKK